LSVQVNVDLSIEGPSHTGLATAAFVSHMAWHLPHLVPLTVLLKHFLKQRCLMDPYTGGLPSYGLVLMVIFLLLRSRHHGLQVRSCLSTWVRCRGSLTDEYVLGSLQVRRGSSPLSSSPHASAPPSPSSSPSRRTAVAFFPPSSAHCNESPPPGMGPSRRPCARKGLGAGGITLSPGGGPGSLDGEAGPASGPAYADSGEGPADVIVIPHHQQSSGGAIPAEYQRRLGVKIADYVLGQVGATRDTRMGSSRHERARGSSGRACV
jgi:hypothetical protein